MGVADSHTSFKAAEKPAPRNITAQRTLGSRCCIIIIIIILGLRRSSVRRTEDEWIELRSGLRVNKVVDEHERKYRMNGPFLEVDWCALPDDVRDLVEKKQDIPTLHWLHKTLLADAVGETGTQIFKELNTCRWTKNAQLKGSTRRNFQIYNTVRIPSTD